MKNIIHRINALTSMLLLLFVCAIGVQSYAQTSKLDQQFTNYELRTLDEVVSEKYSKSVVRSSVQLNLGKYGKYDIVLETVDVVAPDYQIIMGSKDGIEIIKPELPSTYKGYVKGVHDSEVRLTEGEGFLGGLVRVEKELVYFAPAYTKDKSFLTTEQLIIYKAADYPSFGNGCAHEKGQPINLNEDKIAATAKNNQAIEGDEKNGQSCPSRSCLELEYSFAHDADSYNLYVGPHDNAATAAHILNNVTINIINNGEIRFDDEFRYDIKFRVKEMYVDTDWSAWTNNTTNSYTYRNNFRDWANGANSGFTQNYDLCCLYMGATRTDGIEGIAYFGGLCGDQTLAGVGTGNAQPDRYHLIYVEGNTNYLFPHEIGHNLSNFHTGNLSIMQACASCSWDAATVIKTENYIDQVGCLRNVSWSSCEDPGYCCSQGNNSTYAWINRVRIDRVDNTSGNNGGYGHFMNDVDHKATLRGSGTYNIIVDAGYLYSSLTSYHKFDVWLDYNDDGDFSDANEHVASVNGGTSLNASFTIPNTANGDWIKGHTRMRVILSFIYKKNDPCGNFYYGEVEDYSVFLHPYYLTENDAGPSLTREDREEFNNLTATTEAHRHSNKSNPDYLDLLQEIGILEAQPLTSTPSFNLYPNPAKDHFWIKNNSTKSLVSYKLFSLSGQLMLEGQFTDENDMRIDASTLQAGTYFIQTTDTQQQNMYEKVVIVK